MIDQVNELLDSSKLIDPFNRHITYLRLSVTDRCDLRCTYCMSEKMTFLNKKEEIIYKSKPVEVFEFTEQREDKRYFKFLIRNDSDKETIKVFQGGRGFNVDWELD